MLPGRLHHETTTTCTFAPQQSMRKESRRFDCKRTCPTRTELQRRRQRAQFTGPNSAAIDYDRLHRWRGWGLGQDRLRIFYSGVVPINDVWDGLVETLINEAGWSRTILDGLQHVICKWSIRWLFADHADEVTWPKDCYDTTSLTEAKAGYFLWAHARTRRRSQVPSLTVKVVRPRLHECFVVHFYNGLRRRGDIQYWILSCFAIRHSAYSSISRHYLPWDTWTAPRNVGSGLWQWCGGHFYWTAMLYLEHFPVEALCRRRVWPSTSAECDAPLRHRGM